MQFEFNRSVLESAICRRVTVQAARVHKRCYKAALPCLPANGRLAARLRACRGDRGRVEGRRGVLALRRSTQPSPLNREGGVFMDNGRGL
jgi:hypothetical protein